MCSNEEKVMTIYDIFSMVSKPSSKVIGRSIVTSATKSYCDWSNSNVVEYSKSEERTLNPVNINGSTSNAG